MKKLVAFILVLALCLSLCTVTAFADDNNKIDTINITNITGITPDNKMSDVSFTITDNRIDSSFTQIIFVWDATHSAPYYKITDDETFAFEKGVEYSIKVALKTKADCFFKVKNEEGQINPDYSLNTPKGYSSEPSFVGDVFTGDVEQSGGSMNENEAHYTSFWINVTLNDEDDDTPINCKELAKGAAIAAGITVATVGTIHTVKAIKNYKAAKIAAAEEAKLAEMPMVAFGDSGDAVTTLQTELNAQGYDCGEVDGIFGQNTLNAVIAFQTANGLDADGVVGAQTWGALL